MDFRTGKTITLAQLGQQLRSRTRVAPGRSQAGLNVSFAGDPNVAFQARRVNQPTRTAPVSRVSIPRGGGPFIAPPILSVRPTLRRRPTPERTNMLIPTVGRPGDQRGFIHKKLLKVVSRVSSFVPGPAGQIVSSITGRLAGGGTGRTPPRTLTARPSQFSAAEKELGRNVKFPGMTPIGTKLARPCDFPMVTDSQGRCRKPTSGEFGGEQFGVGEAVMGQYGAALEPGSMIVDRAVCLRGMQLGNDGLCYNKTQIRNNQRMWPAGRKPLLSGGDMRAIQIAARAGKRLEGATKRLQRMGMMKKPGSSRRALPRARGVTVKEAGAGGVTIQ